MKFEPVRSARETAGLPLAAIAQATGHSLGWVYQLERSLVSPRRHDAEAIARLLGKAADELFSKIREDPE